jgi:ATPase subunit of ABC transporter with duplicated ATPase domains
LQDITLTVSEGDRIGILGLNGAGKSTLIRLLVSEPAPAKSQLTGTVTTHPRLKLSYYSQHAVEQLQGLGHADPSLTALSLLTNEVDGALDEGELRGLLGSLGLQGRTASDVPLRKLSGGQLVRCELARLLWRRPGLLVLDEVTTHLDYETVSALREALRGWGGAVVLVSHDRWFMRGVVEGVVDDDEGSEVEEEEHEEEMLRRRVVYKLAAGKLSVLERGVQQFEEGMERRVRKLMGD